MSDHPASNDAWTKLLAAVNRSWPASRWRDLGVVVGCSGGADSVALVRALCQNRGDPELPSKPRGFVAAAHFNHATRGNESDDDQAFVSQFAAEMGISLETARAGGTDTDEATMRAEREQFFKHIAERLGARYVAVAHSADDNVETVLHHLLRGTGPAGLAGIPTHRDLGSDVVLVRPLLSTSRASIRQGLRSVGQPWREDSSNQNVDYRRNWIRHQLLPLIETEYPNAVDAIGRAIAAQRSWRDTIDALARDWLNTHRESSNPIRVTRDKTTDESIIIAALQSLWMEQRWPRGDMSRPHWQRLANTISTSDPQRYTLPGGIDVVADDSSVTLQPS